MIDNSFEIAPDIVKKYYDKFKLSNSYTEDIFSKEALTWFRQRISKDAKQNAKQILNSDYRKKKSTQSTQLLGRLYLFQYQAENPGHKDTETYDMFPMVFFFNSGKSKDDKAILWGLNTHYLMPRERQILLLELLKIRSSKNITINTKVKMTWDIIKAVVDSPIYEKAVHAYRADRFVTPLTEIPATDWPVAVFLNLQKFVHIRGEKVYRTDIRRSINKH